jgi:hypothetical protein
MIQILVTLGIILCLIGVFIIGECLNNKKKFFKDVHYHTGYYRFNECFDSNIDNFKIDGIPCIQQYGIKDFIFFTETDITSNNNVIPVKIN